MLAQILKRFMELGVSGCYQVFKRKTKKRWVRFCYKRILFNPGVTDLYFLNRLLLNLGASPIGDGSTSSQPSLGSSFGGQAPRARQIEGARPEPVEGCELQKRSNKKTKTAKSIDIDFLEKIINSEEFNLYLPHKFKDSNWILQQADLAASNCFDILGSGIKCFEKIPWHQDFKSPDFASLNFASRDFMSHDFTSNNSTKSWKHSFYQDITASCPTNIKLDEYNPDIKVPWELSRFQHIFVLGKAYQITQNNKYADAFQNQISDWIEQNPYMTGVNWVCPMDVAIREINWIWGFYFFKDSPNISNAFWIKFINILHLHLHYLEFNWETSDKPNNHYISDLVGYLYLCEFFKIKNAHINNAYANNTSIDKKKNRCIKKILEQFFHQIQPDGTCYEGTTGYHKLDTELFLHFKLICNATQNSNSNCKTKQAKNGPTGLPTEFLSRFYKMIGFLQACSDLSGSDESENFVTIGDNDSGKILTGIETPSTKRIRNQHDILPPGQQIDAKQKSWVQNFPDFGLICIRNECLHVTFRLPKFKQNQPSGHFHYDQLAVTLSINGTPILIDPGSYVYTANSSWRNLMRGPQSHNTFHSPELMKMQNELFQLKLTTQDNPVIIDQTNNIIQVTACNKFNSCDNEIAYRTIETDKEKNLKLTDWWNTTENSKNQINSEWNLIFNPELKLKKEADESWSVEKNNKPICRIFSTLDFVMLTGFYSKNYGTLQTCTKLKATKTLSNQKQTILIKSNV